MIYTCGVCGYKYNDEKTGAKWEQLEDDWSCPLCDSAKINFTSDEEIEIKKEQPLTDGYVCIVCGYIYNEINEGKPFNNQSEGYQCPICSTAKNYFEKISPSKEEPLIVKKSTDSDLSYLSGYERDNDSIEKHMDIIHTIAKTGKYVSEPMRTKLPIISWDDILFLGAQLDKFPLLQDDEVSSKTIIGKNAKKPMVLDHPVYITHMSFGALSKELKISMATGSSLAKTAMCSGEGGILKESMKQAYKYIFEYVPNLYSVTDENLKKVDAIEIKIGQGTKPGMGGHLPGSKVTKEIAEIRGKPEGKDILSPSKFKDIKSKDDLKNLVDKLREISEGRSIGVKIAAGRIEKDLAFIAYAKPDFVTIDGRGGATGSSPKALKDSTTLPTIYALYRARKFLDDNNLSIDLVITGGLRISSDFAKALAMGADAIAIGTAAMMACACQQFRVCNNGKCPVGCATQDEELRKRLDMDNSAKRLFNYLTVTLDEIKTFARITGVNDVHKLNIDDLCTTNIEISKFTNISHV